MQTNNHYATTDTSLASYLITCGFALNRIDYSGQRFSFHFEGDYDSIKSQETQYIAGLARVDPATYSRVMRNLQRNISERTQWRQ